MTRPQLIDLTVAKLEEISPFVEPESLLARDDAGNNNVKPIKSYINEMLDDAARYCLDVLPFTLLAKDIETYKHQTVKVDEKGVGRLYSVVNKSSNPEVTVFSHIDTYVRPVRVAVAAWAHHVRAFITSMDALYMVQQDEDARGKTEKPCVAIVPEDKCLELFSFPESDWAAAGQEKDYSGEVTFSLIKTNKTAENVSSDIAHFIAIRCCELVLNIFNDTNHAAICAKEFTDKMNSVLK